MKQNNKPDYRLETQAIMEKLKIPMYEVCTQLRISEGTYRNWKTGLKSPTTSNFESLKQLASGNILPPFQSHSPPPDRMDELRAKMNEMMGHIKQLTSQIKEAQSDIGALKNEHGRLIAESEKKISELSEAVRVALEQLASRDARQKRA